MPVPEGYALLQNWWWYDYNLPTRSIFPDERGGPGWIEGDIPGKRFKSTQGWKLHICVHPEDVENLFDATRISLQNVAHKFYPFDAYQQIGVGYKSSKEYTNSEGKACAIYPESPTVLKKLVRQLDNDIQNAITILRRPIRGRVGGQLRPLPGGIRNELALGNTGFIYCRYGGFMGDLATKHQVWDPFDKKPIKDPRYSLAYPSFIKTIPSEIRVCKRQ